MRTILGIQFVAGIVLPHWIHASSLLYAFRHYGETSGPSLFSLSVITLYVSFPFFLVLGAIAGLCGQRWGIWISCVSQLSACLAASYYVFLSFEMLRPRHSSPFGIFFLLYSGPIFILSLSGFVVLLKYLIRTPTEATNMSMPT
jgi:hypothetical protein